eukprot:6305955-Pyramimonas_sp.AAC.1
MLSLKNTLLTCYNRVSELRRRHGHRQASQPPRTTLAVTVEAPPAQSKTKRHQFGPPVCSRGEDLSLAR